MGRKKAPRRSAWLPAFLLAALVLATAAPARATFPGQNGRLFFRRITPAGNLDVFSASANGGDIRNLTHFGPHRRAEDFSISADGKKIVIDLRNPDTDSHQLYVLRADGSGLHRLFRDPSSVDLSPAWSPDGRRVTFTRCTRDFECHTIAVVNDNGKHLKTLVRYRSASPLRPAYSPDGRKMAFAALRRDGRFGAIYVMHSDGSHVRQTTPGFLTGLDPEWAPDGSRIVFWSHCCNPGNPQIWAVNPDGTNLVN